MILAYARTVVIYSAYRLIKDSLLTSNAVRQTRPPDGTSYRSTASSQGRDRELRHHSIASDGAILFCEVQAARTRRYRPSSAKGNQGALPAPEGQRQKTGLLQRRTYPFYSAWQEWSYADTGIFCSRRFSGRSMWEFELAVVWIMVLLRVFNPSAYRA